MRKAHYDYAWITLVKNESRKTLHNRIYDSPQKSTLLPKHEGGSRLLRIHRHYSFHMHQYKIQP